jgi:hypothetical protein
MPGKETPTPQEEQPEAPITAAEQSEAPSQAAEDLESDAELQDVRDDYNRAVTALHDQLNAMIRSNESLGPLERGIALGQLKSFINQLSTKAEAFGMGQRVKFKVSAKIGKLFKISVGQDFLTEKSENMEDEAKPYKLKFKVAIQPLRITFGHEQYNEGDGSMGLADKKNQYVEITVFDNGETGVRLYGGRKVKAAEGGEDVTYTQRASVSTNDIYLEQEFTLKPGEGLPGAAVNMLLAARLGKGDVNAGAFIGASGSGEARGGLQVMGTF